ncbi:MAG: hypothetical protein OXU45_06280 [Candidatus Melainabacteria bacterium]|nr:hypothetical protein [Candidatus Melainabacteria bacterium]
MRGPLSLRARRAWQSLCFTLIIINLNSLPALSKEILQAHLHYQLPKSQKVKLRVTKIPKKFPWVERNLDGKVELPEIGSTIVAENTEAIKLKDPYGKLAIIPAGSKFYAEISDKSAAKSFWRQGHASLEFYKLELKQGQEIDISDINFNSAKNSNLLVSGVKNISAATATSVAGAIAAPLAVFRISSLAGLGMASNPALLGSAAAIGGGIGLSYGIKRKGKQFIIEPGTELSINIKEPWLIAETIDNPSAMLSESIKKVEPQFDLEITKVKHKRDDFGDKCIKVSLKYKNHSKEELRYTSFQLVDSMGKAYSPNPKSFSNEYFGELPSQGKLDLYFSSEFPNTTHQLQVLRYLDRKIIASEKILI